MAVLAHRSIRVIMTGLKSLAPFTSPANTGFVRSLLRSGSRGTAVASVATALLVGIVGLVPLASADASKDHAKMVVATGSIICNKVSGSVTYHPAEHHVSTGPVRIVFVFHASHCTTKDSNVKNVTGGSLSEVVTKPTNACASGISSHPVHATGTWTAKNVRLHSTTGTYSGFDFVIATNGDVGVVIPNSGGTAHITGSFAGTNHGATSKVVSYINLTATEIRAACLSPRGLSSVRITSGRVTSLGGRRSVDELAGRRTQSPSGGLKLGDS